ncbi:MAG TPA: TetR/AcrR family transcriptional regulator [Pyrinomonadaceae bacterium]|nr:TetR/AcrR family transcriptional regulator [Pyrinomonadaceae bacterium]
MTRQAENARPEAPPGTPPTGGRMAADERRLQIAQVAMRLFSERGFRGTTTKEIAQAAGVSEAIIFRHFATKEDLYTAIIDYKGCAGLGASPVAAETETPVVEQVCHSVSEALERGDDRAVFEGVALSMLEHHQSDPDFLRLLMYLALEKHTLAQVFWDKNVRVLYEFLGGYIRRRQTEGAFRDVDPFAAVRVLIGAVIHHSLVNLLWDKDPARRLLNVPNEEAARQFVDMFLRGVAADAAESAPRNNADGEDVKNIDIQDNQN